MALRLCAGSGSSGVVRAQADRTVPLRKDCSVRRAAPGVARKRKLAAVHGAPEPRPPPLQGFLAEGLQRTSAGLGSVIIDSQPLTVALLAALLFGEHLGAAGVAGLFLGVAGLCLLEVPPTMLASLPDTLAAAAAGLAGVGGGAADLAAVAAAAGSGDGGSEWSIWDSGEWWMLLAAQSMAIGTVMVRWVARYCDPVVATGWHMILGGMPLLALAIWQEGGEAAARLPLLTGARRVPQRAQPGGAYGMHAQFLQRRARPHAFGAECVTRWARRRGACPWLACQQCWPACQLAHPVFSSRFRSPLCGGPAPPTPPTLCSLRRPAAAVRVAAGLRRQLWRVLLQRLARQPHRPQLPDLPHAHVCCRRRLPGTGRDADTAPADGRCGHAGRRGPDQQQRRRRRWRRQQAGARRQQQQQQQWRRQQRQRAGGVALWRSPDPPALCTLYKSFR